MHVLTVLRQEMGNGVPLEDQTPKKIAWQKYRTLSVGLLLLSGLILLSTHFGELERFTQLLRQVQPAWLMIAIVLQLATYVSVSLVWLLALRSAGIPHSFLSLIPLGIAKLFSDIAIPTAGMSGAAFLVAALNRRGIPNNLCMATLLLSVVSFYAASLLAAMTTVLLLFYYQALHAWIVLVVVTFSLVAVLIPTGALSLRRLEDKKLPRLLRHIPGLNNVMEAITSAPRELLQNKPLILLATVFHESVFVLDAATLWVMLQVVNVDVSFWAVLPCFVMAFMVTTIGPIPLGLGTFEITCVSMLGVMGVPLEAALTATLLLRGFTLWLPIIPGMWIARWALR